MVYAKMSALVAALSWPVRPLFRPLVMVSVRSARAGGVVSPAAVLMLAAVAPVVEATAERERVP